MITFYRSVSHSPQIAPTQELLSGSWVRCERPGEDELATLIELGLDGDILRDSLDPHEVPRIDSENDWTYFITRLPDTDDDFNDFTTPILVAIGH